jgi:ribose 5-phosphate isomerase B
MIAIGADHGGYELKEKIKAYLDEKGIEYVDYGCNGTDSVDYPVYGEKVADAVSQGKAEKGILCCGTGLGMMLCANKKEGVRAICTNDSFSVKFSRLHNNANVIAFGGRTMGIEAVLYNLEIFLNTEFEGGRHQKRVEMYDKIL